LNHEVSVQGEQQKKEKNKRKKDLDLTLSFKGRLVKRTNTIRTYLMLRWKIRPL
jgi:hypothetical protein